MRTEEFKEAVYNILKTGAAIRTQSPLLRGINDKGEIWSRMWNEQVSLGMVPYYMFVERDTGPKHYFELSLSKALQVYQEAIRGVSGLARTARGPSMSAYPGKVCVEGVTEIGGQKSLYLEFTSGKVARVSQSSFLCQIR